MSLVENYKNIRKSIVAFVCKYKPKNHPEEPDPAFPPIIGTGFVVDADGLIATNHHVIRAFEKVWKPKDAKEEDWGVIGILFHLTPEGMMQFPLEVIGAGVVGGFDPGKNYYGPVKPDIGIVHVKARELPCVTVEEKPILVEGMEIATAGFPMGEDTLMAPGWLHQITPTLQRGIISAILPFECEEYHALAINIMTQGGASGSPVFFTDSGNVIGILYAGLKEPCLTTYSLPSKIRKAIEKIEPSLHSHLFQAPTNISYVVPSRFIPKSIEQVKSDPSFSVPQDAQTIEEMKKTMPRKSSLEAIERDRKNMSANSSNKPSVKEFKINIV
ncbi:MAG: serine protease [Candidatus Omnitrophota bacterium]